MKLFERLTLVAVGAAYTGYLIHQAVRARAEERWCRLAAGESAFERSRSGLHRNSTALKPRSFNGRLMAQA